MMIDVGVNNMFAFDMSRQDGPKISDVRSNDALEVRAFAARRPSRNHSAIRDLACLLAQARYV